MSAQGNQGEPAIAFLMLMALIVGFMWLFWHISGGFWMDNVFRWMRFGELWVVNLFTHQHDACLEWLRIVKLQDPTPSSHVVAATHMCFGKNFMAELSSNEAWSYYQLTTKSFMKLSSGIFGMPFYRFGLIGVLAFIALYGIFTSPHNKFLTRHTLESLIVTQAKMWPIISPIVKINPSKSGRVLGEKIPDKLPLFAEALSPEEWISWCRIPVVNGIPDRDATRRSFIRQLGPRWHSMAAVPLHMRALLAAFALKGAQRRDESDLFLGRLALAWSPEHGFRPDSKLKDEIGAWLKDPEVGGKLEPVVDRHAWRTTAMLGALAWARANGGVLAPAQFLWLRAEDRALWYPLNNLGRRSFHSEGAGAMAHFMAEQAAKKPLPIPRIDTAVVTLNTYLHDPDKRTIPIPPHEGDDSAA